MPSHIYILKSAEHESRSDIQKCRNTPKNGGYNFKEKNLFIANTLQSV